MSKPVTCPECDGRGETAVPGTYGATTSPEAGRTRPCLTCDGQCTVPGVVVASLPLCDICGDDETLAVFDAKTFRGSWANLCLDHYQEFGIGLGTGRGQHLITASQEGTA